MALITNAIELQGRINRIDIREGKTKEEKIKESKPFVSVTFTLDIEGQQIKVEYFSMKFKKDGSEMNSYTGLMTLFNEAKALHKTIRKEKDDKATEIDNDTIVKDINECTALKCSNYNGFKYTRFEENTFVKDGNLVRNIRIAGAYPNRVDEDKREYKPTRDFEVCGYVTKAPIVLEKDEEEYLEVDVIVPTFVEGYEDRPDSVVLNKMTFTSHNQEVFDYIIDEFQMNSFVYINGRIFRTVDRIEIEVPSDNEGRGFGRKIEHQAKFETKVKEYFEIEGGWELTDDEVEEEKAFNTDLWTVAKEVKDKKEEKMLNGGDKEKPRKGFGREGSGGGSKKPKMPF